jgi:hypothetical protein
MRLKGWPGSDRHVTRWCSDPISVRKRLGELYQIVSTSADYYAFRQVAQDKNFPIVHKQFDFWIFVAPDFKVRFSAESDCLTWQDWRVC